MSRRAPIGRTVTFEVVGRPIPQGSTRAFAIRKGGGKGAPIVGVGTTNDASGSLSKWRGDIRNAATLVLEDGFARTIGPVRVELVFRLRRPASHYLPANKSRPKRVLRPDAPLWCSAGPDLDKLVRAVMDALTGVVYIDDQQVFDLADTRKVWSEEDGLRATVGFMDRVVEVGEVMSDDVRRTAE